MLGAEALGNTPSTVSLGSDSSSFSSLRNATLCRERGSLIARSQRTAAASTVSFIPSESELLNVSPGNALTMPTENQGEENIAGNPIIARLGRYPSKVYLRSDTIGAPCLDLPELTTPSTWNELLFKPTRPRGFWYNKDGAPMVGDECLKAPRKLETPFYTAACQGSTSRGEGNSGASHRPQRGGAERGGTGTSKQTRPESTKRARISGKDAPGDSDEEEDEGKPNRRRPHPKSPSNVVEKYLACPFVKWNWQKYHKCAKLRITEIRYVRQHLSRRHKQPPTAESTAPKVRHSHEAKGSYETSEPENREWVTEAELEFLTERSSALLGRSMEDQWNFIFKTLFPNEPPPATPYLDNPVTTDLRQLKAFAAREGPVVALELCRQLPPEHQQPQPEKLGQLIERGVSEVLRRYGWDQDLSNPAPTAAYQNGSASGGEMTEWTSGQTPTEEAQAPEVATGAGFHAPWNCYTVNPARLTLPPVVEHDQAHRSVAGDSFVTNGEQGVIEPEWEEDESEFRLESSEYLDTE